MLKYVRLKIDLPDGAQRDSWVFISHEASFCDYMRGLLPDFRDMCFCLSGPENIRIDGLTGSQIRSFQEIACTCSERKTFPVCHDDWFDHFQADIDFYEIPPNVRVFNSITTRDFCDHASTNAEIREQSFRYSKYRLERAIRTGRAVELIYLLAFNDDPPESMVFVAPQDIPGWACFIRNDEECYKFIHSAPNSGSIFLATENRIDKFDERFPLKPELSTIVEPENEIIAMCSSGTGPAVLLVNRQHGQQIIRTFNDRLNKTRDIALDDMHRWVGMEFIDGRYLLLSESGDYIFESQIDDGQSCYSVILKDRRFVFRKNERCIFEWEAGNIHAWFYDRVLKKVHAFTSERKIVSWWLNDILYTID